MADDQTGPEEMEPTEDGVEITYVQGGDDFDGPPDDDGQPARPADNSDRRKELAKKLNLDQLPEDPDSLYDAVEKRVDEIRRGLTEAHEDRSKTEKEMAELRGRLDTLMGMVGPNRANPKRELPAWAAGYKPPEGANDVEVLLDFTQKAIENSVGSKVQKLESLQHNLALQRAEEMVNAKKAEVGDDVWVKIEPEVTDMLNRGLDLDRAVTAAMATTGTLEDRIKREYLEGQQRKKTAAGGGVTKPGVTRTSTKMPDPRTASWQTVAQWAVEESERELAGH